MMTPFDVRDEVERVKRHRALGGAAHQLIAERKRQQLYLAVLREIARGTIDPRSLAMAALEAE